MGLFILEKRSLRRDLLQVCKYQMWGNDEGARLFLVLPTDRAREKKKKFHLNSINLFFPVKTVKHWNRLLRKVVASPALKIFRSWLDNLQDSWICLILLDQGSWTTWSQEVTYNLKFSITMWILLFSLCYKQNQENIYNAHKTIQLIYRRFDPAMASNRPNKVVLESQNY